MKVGSLSCQRESGGGYLYSRPMAKEMAQNSDSPHAPAASVDAATTAAAAAAAVDQAYTIASGSNSSAYQARHYTRPFMLRVILPKIQFLNMDFITGIMYACERPHMFLVPGDGPT